MAYFAKGDRIGDWEIQRRIGRGGMGVVYAAVHAAIGKRAAIKVLRAELRHEPALRARFVHEAQIVNRLAHPGVVDVFQIGHLDDGRVYLVMELLIGQTVGQLMRSVPPSFAETTAIVTDVCDVLACAHAHGVVHRDVKPDNLVVAGGGRVKVIDWGLARAEGLRDDVPDNTMVGTPRYLAPEQTRGGVVDERADVYSLGVVTYELLAGRPPFVSESVAELVHMHRDAAPPALRAVAPHVPPALAEVVMDTLAKDPADRPGLRRLRAALADARVAAPALAA